MDLTKLNFHENDKLLGARNYLNWAYKVERIFRSNKLWDLVVPSPTSSADSSSQSTASSTPGGSKQKGPSKEEAKEAALLEERIEKCLNIFSFTVSSVLIPSIRRMGTSPSGIWNRLKQRFESAAEQRKIDLKDSLTNLTMKEGTTIEQFLIELDLIVVQLSDIDEEVEDKALIHIVLKGLPPSWRTFKTTFNTMMGQRGNAMTFADLETQLQAEELHMLRNEATDQALFTSARSSNRLNQRPFTQTKKKTSSRQGSSRRSSDSRSAVPVCTHPTCLKRGHKIEQCRLRETELQLKTLSLQQLNQLQHTIASLSSAPHQSLHAEHKDDGGSSDDPDFPEEVNLASMRDSSGKEINLSALLASTGDDWVIDSGASSHYSNRRANISDFAALPTSTSVTTAAGSTLPVAGTGCINAARNKVISRVLYVPDIKSNLLSVGSFADRGHLVLFNAQHCYVMDRHDKSKVFLQGHRDPRNRLYTVQLPGVRSSPLDSPAACTVYDQADISNSHERLWHRRLGHPNYQRLYHMSTQNLVRGLPTLRHVRCFCAACLEGKQHRAPLPRVSVTTTQRPLQLVHTDLCGPLPVASRNHSRYFMLIVDDFTRYTWIFFLKKKSEALSHFKDFVTQVENLYQARIGIIRSDRGGEYTSDRFSELLKAKGIFRQLTTARTPEQNGVAERKNRTLIEAVRSMAAEAHIPAFLWEELFRTATYLQNRTTTRSLSKSTPYEKLHKEKPDVTDLRVIGSAAHIWIPPDLRNKLATKSKEAIMVGYDDSSKAYRCYCPSDQKIYISRNVQFNETLGHDFSSSAPDVIDTQFFDSILESVEPELPADVADTSAPLPDDGPALEQTEPTLPDLPDDTMIEPSSSPASPAVPLPTTQLIRASLPGANRLRAKTRKVTTPLVPLISSSRIRRTPRYLTDYYHDSHLAFKCEDPVEFALETLHSLDEEMTVAEALVHPGWSAAITSEFDSLMENDTWDYCDLPNDRRALDSRWVLRVKHDLNPTHTRLKARLVAKGYEQQSGIDYGETFAPVVKWSTLRTIVAIAAACGWPISHLDVITAFLNGKLRETIYMRQPPGYELKGFEHLVCRLKRSIYGLKQSPRTWYEEIDKYLRTQGWNRSLADPNLYFIHNGEYITILLLYVDDLLVTGSDSAHIAAVKQQLQGKYKMKDLGEAQRYLGVDFHTSDQGILLHQKGYAEKVVADAGMADCKPASVPLPLGTSLADDSGTPSFDQNVYCHTVGQLLYLTNTRPDISYAVNYVSRFMAKPQLAHWQAVQHIVRYVQGTTDQGIFYSRHTSLPPLHGFIKTSTPLQFAGFSDADWAACKNSRRSTGGYAFILSGGAITWSSRRQPTVSLSTTEAEYRALADSSKEAVHLRRLLQELRIPTAAVPLACSDKGVTGGLLHASQPTEIDVHLHCDNISAIKLAKNPVFHARSKHIEIQHHFVRERILEGEVTVDYISTNEQPADILTKALSPAVFNKHKHTLGMQSLHDLSQ